MQRSDWIVIGLVLVVDLLAIIAIALLTVLVEGSVWLQFVIMLGYVCRDPDRGLLGSSCARGYIGGARRRWGE